MAVSAHVDNEKSNRAIGKYVEVHGGRKEGTLRNWDVYGDEPVDVHRYSVSSEEWTTNRSEESVDFDGI